MSCWSKKKRRTGGKTGEEEVEKVEEHQFVGDGGARLLSGRLRSSLHRWKKSREEARGCHEIGRRGGEEGAGGDCIEESTGVDGETSVSGMRKYLQELKRRNSARATIQGQADGGEVKQEDHFRKKFREDVPVGLRGGSFVL